mgnify:CR=1 FL=1
MSTKNEQIAAAFRAAKLLLSHGTGGKKPLYICYALNRVPDSGDAKRVIQSRLCLHITVDGYLAGTVGVPKKLLTRKNVQEFRHRWLDTLIVEFSQPSC